MLFTVNWKPARDRFVWCNQKLKRMSCLSCPQNMKSV